MISGLFARPLYHRALEAVDVEQRLLGEGVVHIGDVVLVVIIVQLWLGLVDVNVMTSAETLLVGLDVPQLYRCGHLI